MTLAEIVKFVKRKARYGDIDVTDDQATADVVQSLNNRMFRIWRRWPWDWLFEDISISATAGEANYTLGANVGDIIVLDAGGDDYLRWMSLKTYLERFKRSGETQGTPTRYVKLGRNSSNNLKIRFWKTPSQALTITGWGKKRITKYSTSDISSNTGIAYFPEEMHEILIELMLGDIAAIQGDKAEAAIREASGEKLLNLLIPEDETHADEDIVSPAPSRIIFGRRNRGGTKVV